MRKKYIIVIFFFFIIHLFGSEDKGQINQEDQFNQYLIGIEYLESTKDLSEKEKVIYYKKLVEITGISADSAKKYIAQYKNNPKEWIKKIDYIIKIIESFKVKDETDSDGEKKNG